MTKILGVIGGLGPLATAYFYELITKMTAAVKDQDHIEIMIHSKPSIPDRTAYILDNSKESPLPPMIDIGKKLAHMGVDHISIPCITAHYFYDKLSSEIPVPIIHGIRETVEILKCFGVSKVGIMATDGTIQSNLFQHELEDQGITPVVPAKMFQGYIMDLIYNCVKSCQPVDMAKFTKASAHLKGNGAEAIILGCTELSLIKRDYSIGPGYLDVMEVLARASILKSHGEIRRDIRILVI
jgi:aspartate racemase